MPVPRGRPDYRGVIRTLAESSGLSRGRPDCLWVAQTIAEASGPSRGHPDYRGAAGTVPGTPTEGISRCWLVLVGTTEDPGVLGAFARKE